MALHPLVAQGHGLRVNPAPCYTARYEPPIAVLRVLPPKTPKGGDKTRNLKRAAIPLF